MVSPYLGDMDGMSLCIAYPQLQSLFFPQLKNLPILVQPFLAFEYDIDRCRRLAHLLALSSDENLTSFHKIPRTLHIGSIHKEPSARNHVSLETLQSPLNSKSARGRKEETPKAWSELFSILAMSCPNINEFTYGGSESVMAHDQLSGSARPAKGNACACEDCVLSGAVESLAPMPNLTKLCFFNNANHTTQCSIAHIISQAHIQELTYFSDGSTYIHEDLVSRIQSTQSLRSLTILNHSTSLAISPLIVRLCSAFATIHHLKLDDTWQAYDIRTGGNALMLISTLNMVNLRSFEYEAICYGSDVNREFQLNCRAANLLNVLPMEDHRATSLLRTDPHYVRYLGKNNGMVLTDFFISYPNLTSVKLSKCSFLNDSFFSSIWECLPNLSELSIQNCPWFFGIWIRPSHGTGWTKLEILDVSTCKNIISPCIVTIAKTTKASRVQLLLCERPTSTLETTFAEDIQGLGYHVGHTHQPNSTMLLRGFRQAENALSSRPVGMEEKSSANASCQ